MHREGRALLVRPDGHLAWRGKPDPDALRRALTAMLDR
ncbi:aromatic-ring hydroxylase C-terminal domain-containing protein [Saccharothrix sp. NRRL B-16348]